MSSHNDIMPGDYIYICGIPADCVGHRYRVHRTVIDVCAAYQRKTLVEALSGPDLGEWFTVTPANFRVRFRPVTPDDGPPPATNGHRDKIPYRSEEPPETLE